MRRAPAVPVLGLRPDHSREPRGRRSPRTDGKAHGGAGCVASARRVHSSETEEDAQDEGPLRAPQPPGAPPGRARSRTRSSCTRRCATRTSSSRSWSRASGRTCDVDARARTRVRRSARSTTTRTSTSSTRSTDRFDFFTMTSRDKALYTQLLRGLPARPQAGHRALPAHALHRLRPDLARPPARCPDVADPLHAARVPADLPPRRPDGAHATASCAWRRRRAAATSASRRSRRRSSSCASASSSRTSSSRPLPRAEPVPARALRRLGHPARADPVRGLRPHARATASSRRATPRDGRATGSASSASSTPTRASTCCCRRWRSCGERALDAHLWLHGANLELQPQEFQEEFARAAGRRGRRQRHARRAVRPRRPRRDLMARDRLGGRALDLVGELAARDPGGVHARPARDLQRHRRHGREGHRRRQRPALPRRRPATAWRACSSARSSTPGLWDKLRAGIPRVYDMDDHVASLTAHVRRAAGAQRSPRPHRESRSELDRAAHGAWLGTRVLLLAGRLAAGGEDARGVACSGDRHVRARAPQALPYRRRRRRGTARADRRPPVRRRAGGRPGRRLVSVRAASGASTSSPVPELERGRGLRALLRNELAALDARAARARSLRFILARRRGRPARRRARPRSRGPLARVREALREQLPRYAISRGGPVRGMRGRDPGDRPAVVLGQGLGARRGPALASLTAVVAGGRSAPTCCDGALPPSRGSTSRSCYAARATAASDERHGLIKFLDAGRASRVSEGWVVELRDDHGRGARGRGARRSSARSTRSGADAGRHAGRARRRGRADPRPRAPRDRAHPEAPRGGGRDRRRGRSRRRGIRARRSCR